MLDSTNAGCAPTIDRRQGGRVRRAAARGIQRAPGPSARRVRAIRRHRAHPRPGRAAWRLRDRRRPPAGAHQGAHLLACRSSLSTPVCLLTACTALTTTYTAENLRLHHHWGAGVAGIPRCRPWSRPVTGATVARPVALAPPRRLCCGKPQNHPGQRCQHHGRCLNSCRCKPCRPGFLGRSGSGWSRCRGSRQRRCRAGAVSASCRRRRCGHWFELQYV